ncbi:MAG TPA: AMP-binding protein [Acidimicrobiia bacterium]|nr:AMP-binding protein [Acidimicrobiia bacterium]
MTTDHIGLLRGTGFPLGKHALAYPTEERTMLRVLRDRAAERGAKDWIVFDSTDHITYAEGWSLTCRVANALRATAGEGAHVGLFMLNQPEFVPVLYGAMANHGVAVPLNAQARGPLLHHVVEHSDATILVARIDLLDRLESLEDLGKVELVVCVGGDAFPDAVNGVPTVGWDEWLVDDDTPPETMPDYRDPCLIQYTSGTSGRAKGAVYPHQFFYIYGVEYVDSLGLTEDDVLSTPLPLFHVAAVHLITGGALHIGGTAHLKSRFSASRFWDEIAADGATYALIFGPMAAIIMKSTDEAPEHRCHKMFCVPPPPELEEFEERFGVQITWHAYGQTEVAPMAVRPETLPGVPRDTLGYPLRWFEYGVVDDHDRMLAPGEIGEIVLRPMIPYMMFMEYYKDPSKTMEAFRNQMFHTGDLGYYDDDGLLHYKGRRQERIRHRGENIAAPELEYVVLTHPKIVEAAAYGVPSEFGEDDVKLDIRVSEDVDPAELHAWFTEQLPKYMVPRYIEIRADFPKTPSERIQKYLLQGLPLDRPEVHDFDPRR